MVKYLSKTTLHFFKMVPFCILHDTADTRSAFGASVLLSAAASNSHVDMEMEPYKI